MHHEPHRFTTRPPLAEDGGRTGGAGQPADSTGPEQRPPVPGLRVLVVDDNRDGAASLAALLRLAGHEVSVCHDGEEAVTLAGRLRPKVILMDLGLPRMNGHQAARAIRSQSWSEGICLIALTGWGQEEARRESRESGFDYHLVKPTEPGQLFSLLAAIGRR
jgi:DNA-binding response OmpR family regulator